MKSLINFDNVDVKSITTKAKKEFEKQIVKRIKTNNKILI